MPATDTLYAARNLDFAPTIWLDYEGDPLPISGGTCTMQVRQYPGAAGDPLAEDTNVTISDAAHETLDDWRTLTIEPSIAQADLAAMPGQNQPEAGDPQSFVYEIKFTYSDDAQDSLMIGTFVLSAGVDDTAPAP
jgi:hypothetical protein